MAAETRGASMEPKRRPVWQVASGIGASLVILVLLVVPVIVMVLLSPRGTPTRLPDPLALALLAVAGVVVGVVARRARVRPAFAATLAVLMTILALWLQAGTWWSAGWVPTPPILPNVAPTVALSAGIFLATTLVAATGAGRRRRDSTAGGDADMRSAPPVAIAMGVAGAAALVIVVEADVRGRRLLQQTFEGPGGMSRFTWLALLFVGLLAAGAVIGWVASSRHAPLAAIVAAVLVAAVVALIWIVGGLGGPPRSTLYGLGLGVLVIAGLWPSRPADRPSEVASDTI